MKHLESLKIAKNQISTCRVIQPQKLDWSHTKINVC